jgi:cell division protein FtsI (penicillin-binding protein 3)
MRDPQDPRGWRRTMAPRLGFLAGFFVVCVAAVIGRLAYLQVFRYGDWEIKRRDQQQETIKVPAERGEILDRHGKVLAYSVESDTVVANARMVKDPAALAAALCQALGDCTADDRADLVKKLSSRRQSIYLRRQLHPDKAKAIAALGRDELFFVKEPHRFYPNRELAANVLGYVGVDSNGLAGIEGTYDSKLKGREGTYLLQVAASGKKGTKPYDRVGEAPVPGATIELTIDANLQYIAERELRAGIDENRAAAGTILMMNPRTGEILAMACWPTFNPNVYKQSVEEARRNRAVQDIYEPGSTFKIVTASAALQEHLMQPTDMIDTGNGTYRIGSRVVDEYHHHQYGVLSFTDVLVKSSNIGAIRIGFRVGAPTLARYVGLFGFGTRLSPDFPGESAGLVWQPSQFNEGALASVSMGYQVSVTPLQMAAAASTVANGGELVQPRVVRAVIDGGERRLVPQKVLRRAISQETASELTSIMEAVVERGTATKAALPDFTVAGKTGTSNKNRGGHYVEEYNTSFVGFVPSRKPALTILVHIDTPRGPNPAAGGAIAAPIFRRVADAALRYMGVTPTINPVPPVLVTRRESASPVPVAGPTTPLTIVPMGSPAGGGQIVIPELRGLSGREALRVLSRLGVVPRIAGNGVVTEQEPAAGTPLEFGGVCRLSLGKPAPGITP